MPIRFLIALITLVSAVPAWARESAAVPEGSNLTLFALGLLGVIVGRRAAVSAKRRQQARESETD